MLRDCFLVVRACLSNALAAAAPSIYVRLTRQTGRGADEESPHAVAAYFLTCLSDYRERLGYSDEALAEFLKGKVVLEYGPGDILGVALLVYAYGARQVHCVDQFPLHRQSERSIEVYRRLLTALQGDPRDRACRAFREYGKPESGLDPAAIAYHVTPDGLAGQTGAFDLILSRAVLEHVRDLQATFRDMSRGLRKGGLALHLVDLKSHGLDRYRTFDFLTWPEFLYRAMYGCKGFPNRWRANKYLELAARFGLLVRTIAPTGCARKDDVDFVRPRIAGHLTDVTAEQLAWLGFWIVLEKPQAPEP
ncbi:MAG: class I SAM-dependent methyltransferase [Burkholderiaceae bacterium]|nr:class I SAM-dependent methyltransferase [Burkholderiaceae bacterium]